MSSNKPSSIVVNSLIPGSVITNLNLIYSNSIIDSKTLQSEIFYNIQQSASLQQAFPVDTSSLIVMTIDNGIWFIFN